MSTSKIKLGQRPKTFKPFPVKFELPEDGTEATIEVTYKYRTRKEFGALVNEMYADAGIVQPKTESGSVDFEKLHQQLGEKSAGHLLKSIEAWNLDERLGLESLKQLCDEMPAAAAALSMAYAAACTEGRLGN